MLRASNVKLSVSKQLALLYFGTHKMMCDNLTYGLNECGAQTMQYNPKIEGRATVSQKENRK